MKKASIILAIFLFTGCRPQKQVITVPIETQTIVRERIVEVPTPADSSMINAYLECDSNFNVLLRRFDERKTSGMATELNLAAGMLSYKVHRFTDTLYIAARDSFIYKEIPITIEVPKEVNLLTKWQNFQIWAGRIFLILLAAALLIIYIAKGRLK